MAKKQDVTVVSDLVGRGKFTVSAKGKMVDGKLVGMVPSTGFEIEVTYKNQIEKMEYAVPTSIICLQNELRTDYVSTGKFSFVPGSRIKCGADGKYARPAPMPTAERLLAATWAQKIMVVETYGLAVPQEWRDALAAEEASAQVTTDTQSEDEDESSDYKYDEVQLSGLSMAKLRTLAQNEELEGYDKLSKFALIQELSLIDK